MQRRKTWSILCLLAILIFYHRGSLDQFLGELWVRFREKLLQLLLDLPWWNTLPPGQRLAGQAILLALLGPPGAYIDLIDQVLQREIGTLGGFADGVLGDNQN